MPRRLLLALVLTGTLLRPALHAQGTTLSGFVTTPGTTQYQVNGVGVLCDAAKTEQRTHHPDSATHVNHQCDPRVLGESVTIEGFRDKHTHTIAAQTVTVDQATDLAVSGYALIDRILAPVTATSGTVRADGLPLTISPATKLTFAEGSNLSAITVGTNQWVRYTGTLHPDGTVAAASLLFSLNQIQPREDKLRAKTDFDAAKVREEDRQGAVSRAFFGPNGKRIPASQDTAAQQRLVTLGTRLIPAYQRALPTNDPTKIDFRFQLVNEPKLHSTLAEPSGVIQVPDTFAAKLNDDELAAVLAADIAEVLEKQTLRAITGNNARGAANVAGAVAGIFLPGAGLATQLVTGKNASIAEHHREEQIARTSLAFLHDADFPLAAAPVAWWKLDDTKNKGIADTRMPYLTQALYQILGTAYRTPPIPTP